MRLRLIMAKRLSRSDYGPYLTPWRICQRVPAGAACCTPFIKAVAIYLRPTLRKFCGIDRLAPDRLAPSEQNTQMVEAGRCATAGVDRHAGERFLAGSNRGCPRFSHSAIAKVLRARCGCTRVFGQSFS